MGQPTGFGLLSLITFLPLAGVILLLLVPEAQVTAQRYVSLVTSVATFVVSLFLLKGFDSSTFHFQQVEYVPWITQLGINYRMGVDGISLWLILLTTFLSVISIWFSFYVDKRVKT